LVDTFNYFSIGYLAHCKVTSVNKVKKYFRHKVYNLFITNSATMKFGLLDFMVVT